MPAFCSDTCCRAQVPPIRRPLSTPDTSPFRELFVSGRSELSGPYKLLVAGGARPCSRLFGAEIRTSHPSGSRCRSREPAPAPLAQSCAPRKSSVPGRVQGLRTAVVSYPAERGASTSWLATWAHLRQRAERRGAEAQSGRDGLIQALVRAPCSPPKSTKGLRGLERHLVAHYVEAGAGHFVGYRPQGHERAGASLFPFVILFGQRLEPDGEVCGLDKGPG